MGVHESDEVLATRILVSRSEDACTDLYNKHLRMAYAVANRFFRSPDNIDFAVNHSFEKAFRRLATWNAGRERFPVWFVVIVQNTCIDHYRRRRSDDDRLQRLMHISRGYSLPEFFSDNPCEYHSARWFNPEVRTFICNYVGRMGRERTRYIIDPPATRLSDLIRARQTRDRHEIAGPLQIHATGRELSRRITNELLLASYCGKLPGGLFQ